MRLSTELCTKNVGNSGGVCSDPGRHGIMRPMRKIPPGPLSFLIIAVSVAVALYSGLGSSIERLHLLFISDPGSNGWQDILNGQVWRLITPIFIHFGVLHILFNCMWIWDLGRAVERTEGSGFYAVFILLTGVASNVAQYLMTGSPFFGGLSGVLYALIGYVWINGRFNPAARIMLHQSTVVSMLIWFVLCWSGLLGPIANWAHTAGLLIGSAWGYGQSRLTRNS